MGFHLRHREARVKQTLADRRWGDLLLYPVKKLQPLSWV
jgi:hypothetical protein